MSALDRVAIEHGIAVEELTVWVERQWILPVASGTEFFFTETDRARVRMIVEFRRDLAIDDEAMPVVLGLVDRLHAAREELRTVLSAVAALPQEEQDVILRRLLGGEAP